MYYYNLINLGINYYYKSINNGKRELFDFKSDNITCSKNVQVFFIK